MAQEPDTPVIELEFVSCEGCDLVFIASERRQTCPTCGGQAVGPYLEFIVTPEGPRLKNGAVAIAQAAPAEETPVAEPAASAATEAMEKEVLEEEEEVRPLEIFAVDTAEYLLYATDVSADQLSEQLLRMGADPETVATTIGRLAAVRDTLAVLTLPIPDAQEEAAAEEPPAAAADLETGEGDSEN